MVGYWAQRLGLAVLPFVVVGAVVWGLVTLSTPGLSDAQRVWCQSHDGWSPAYFGNSDDAVLQAAATLGIAIPPDVQARSAVGAAEINNLPIGDGAPLDSQDVLDAWRQTGDYARACIAAFDASH